MKPADIETDVMKQLCGTLYKAMQEKFKDDIITKQGELLTLEQYPEFAEDEEFLEEFKRVLSNEEIAEADDEFNPYSFDTYINMEVESYQGQDNPHRERAIK